MISLVVSIQVPLRKIDSMHFILAVNKKVLLMCFTDTLKVFQLDVYVVLDPMLPCLL